MKIGLVYPQTEFGNDPALIRDYAQTAEGLGFSHILTYEHVLGVSPNYPGADKLTYTSRHPFQEPLVLYSYMAGLTSRIEFTTGILILPQRQTALVAKQAATLDVLSNGRLRLGVALGWNEAEYISLNEDFHTRGRRIEEQVQVLRLLWTQPLVVFEGRWHHIPDAGLNPLPVQRPIPIWFGANNEPALRRAARLGDGWITNIRKPSEIGPLLQIIQEELARSGRAPGDFGLEARISHGGAAPEEWVKLVEGWRAQGATYLSFNTMAAGFERPEQHLQAIRQFAAAAGVKPG